jgi:glycine hydroxymethyltransferase
MVVANSSTLSNSSRLIRVGKLFRALGYGLLPDTEEIDYDSIQRLVDERKPRMIVAGASAYSRVINWRRFREIADSIGAYLFGDMAHHAGLVAARLYPNPVGIADFVTSTTHNTLRGPRGGFILAAEQHAKALNSIVFPALQGGPLILPPKRWL